ncbi:MAG: uracil-DNA glycosylase [Gemmatales bacterium]|nr:uracil-DNA glycosylase [Gemmatales bacterium]MDW8387250.1 uracil-DNA glycosylase [Gemmatales bacterium]
MSDEAEKRRRHLRWRMEALRSAGVEWLEHSQLKEATVPSSRQRTEPKANSPSLFSDAPAVGPVLSSEEKRRALQLLDENEVRHCTRCPVLVRNRTQTVFGVGNPDAELCFVGEAPGADEDAQGEPFVGAAGQLLNRIIAACKMRREDVYICNVLKCRPPGNRAPLPDEIANCFSFLERQLAIIRPRFICALGACASQALLNTTASIGRLRGRFHDYRGIPVLCTYHPAYLLRNPAAKKDVWDDMKMLMRAMGRPVD